MNTIHANSRFQTISVHGPATLPLVPITGTTQSLSGTAAAVMDLVERRSAIVDEDQIRQALKIFRKQGGLIRKLPPQEVPVRMSVGPQHAEFDYLLEAVGLDFI